MLVRCLLCEAEKLNTAGTYNNNNVSFSVLYSELTIYQYLLDSILPNRETVLFSADKEMDLVLDEFDKIDFSQESLISPPKRETGWTRNGQLSLSSRSNKTTHFQKFSFGGQVEAALGVLLTSAELCCCWLANMSI